MQAYDRVMAAVRHESTDRVPIDYIATPEFHASFKAFLGIDDDECLRQRLGVDIRRVDARYWGPPELSGARGVDAVGEDFLGVVWKPVTNEFGTYNEIVHSPLAGAQTVQDVEGHRWPSVDWFDFSHLKQEIDEINLEQRYAILYFAGGAFETPWYMRGMERYLMDLVECPDIAEAISSRAAEFYKQLALRAIEESAGRIDIIGSGGDIGTQRGMMLAPDMWRRHVKPYSAQLISTFKHLGLTTYYHSCGSLVPVIPDLIEMGLDILDPVQPLAEGMDPCALKVQYGDKLTFHGGVDEQELLPHAEPSEVHTAVEKLIDTVGRSGGYILCPAHAIQPDTPGANALALYEAGMQCPMSG